VVLIRALAPALLVLAACSQSLFSNGDNGGGSGDGGNGGDGGGGGDGGEVPTSCTAPCIVDAGGDFNGSPGGANDRWRYLEDNRNRTWTPMTPSGGGFVGVDSANSITSCSERPSASGCTELPGALLLSSAGGTGAADPAIELTVPGPDQVVQLSLRVRATSNQAVRLYRNSREDVLFAGVAMTGTTLEHTLTFDALAGDRILFALTPSASGAEDVAVQLFVSESGEAFPKHCQVALSFEQAPGDTVPDACGSAWTHIDFTTEEPSMPSLVAGPFPELGQALDIPTNRYLLGPGVLQRPGDFTVQMWVQSDAVNSIQSYGNWVFSDYDLDFGGGLGFVIYDPGTISAEIGTCTDPNTLEFVTGMAAYPNDHAWHFVRIAHTGGTVSMCLDGRKLTSFAAAAGSLQSMYAPKIGRNGKWTPVVAEMDGKVDDVRVFDVALPCE